jgi:hypothetical protein
MRGALFIFIGLVAGFLIHALVFPKILVTSTTPDILGSVQSVVGIEQKSDFITPVTFNKKSFSSKDVTIKRGNYITITNMSTTESMFLRSGQPLLTTVRPYAESEQLKVLLPEIGEFEVIEDHSKAKLKVHVVE